MKIFNYLKNLIRFIILRDLQYGENVNGESLIIAKRLFDASAVNHINLKKVNSTFFRLGYLTFYHFQALLIDKRSSLLEDPTVIDSIVFFKNYTRLENNAFTPNEKGEIKPDYFFRTKENLISFVNSMEMIGFKNKLRLNLMLKGEYEKFLWEELKILNYRYYNHEDWLLGLIKYIENREFEEDLVTPNKRLETSSSIIILDTIKLNSILEDLKEEQLIEFNYLGFEEYFSDSEIKMFWLGKLSEFMCVIELLKIFNIIKTEKTPYKSIMSVFSGIKTKSGKERKEFDTNKLRRESRELNLSNCPKLEINDWLNSSSKNKKFQFLINIVRKNV